MKKKNILFVLGVGLALSASASIAKPSTDSLRKHLMQSEEIARYRMFGSNEDDSYGSGWRNNWFLNISGGANAFIGSPIGCDDLFGRIKPTFSFQIGKWFIPHVGARLTYQGMWFNDCESMSQKYHHAHADLLWNPFGNKPITKGYPMDVIPYVGVGFLHNENNGNNAFALSYGLIGRYRLAQRIHLTMELGSTTTMRNFDGYGDSRELGDHLLSLTAGVSFTFGKSGWKRSTDDTRYYIQDRYLSEHHSDDEVDTSESDFNKRNSINQYSGLVSLLSRLNGESKHDSHADSGSDSTDAMANGKRRIGFPVYMFFKLGTATLTDESQLINLDAIVQVANQQGLKILVVGAADSATGNTDINDRLSADRAQYICSQLKQRGATEDSIIVVSEGGISDYSPTEANRNTKIEICED